MLREATGSKVVSKIVVYSILGIVVGTLMLLRHSMENQQKETSMSERLLNLKTKYENLKSIAASNIDNRTTHGMNQI